MDTDVAIVGGGIVGLSVACSLLESGVERVTLLEREQALGQGSTSKANGGIRAQFTTPINVSFSNYSIAVYEKVDRVSGDALSFRQEGYLLFTGDPDRSETLLNAYKLQRSLGVDTQWLEPDQIVSIAPFIRADGLLCGTFHGRDGFLDPHGALREFARRARSLGAEIRTSAEVLSIQPNSNGYEIGTAQGKLQASKVVNAAGPAAARVAALVGIDLPIHPLRRNMAYVRDDRHPRHLIPMCVDLDTGVLIRREGLDGYVIAYSDPSDPPGSDTSFDPSWIDAVAARIGHRFPHLVDTPVDRKHCWAGLYPETPDGHAIIDEIAELPGFFICGGFGGHGLMHAPAAGRAIAELVIGGTCTTFDLHPLRFSRFDDGDLIAEQTVF